MKHFTNIKTSYTAGTYGCTGEQYYLAAFDGDRTLTLQYDGLFGVEQRVSEHLKQAGYKQVGYNGRFGKVTRRDVKHYYDEREAIEKVLEFLKG